MKQSIFEMRVDGSNNVIRTTASSVYKAISNVKSSLPVGSVISGCVKIIAAE